MFELKNTKYHVDFTKQFKKDFIRVLKQGKSENKLLEVLKILANGKKLDKKYKNHKLIKNKIYDNCYECHIEPDLVTSV